MSNPFRQVTDFLKRSLGSASFDSNAPPVSLSETYPNDTFIVSYPRSGNSFLQHLICNYLHPDGFDSTPSIIPDLHMNPGRLTEIDRPRIIKSHEETPQPYPNVIYVARDGRDVAISYHAFLIRSGSLSEDVSLEDFLRGFNKGTYEFGSWNDHVTRWLDTHHDALVVRYEDMLENGERQLSRVLEFMDRPVDADRVAQAAEASQFNRLQNREKERKKESGATPSDIKEFFFRKGEKRQWVSTFTDEMNTAFVEHNRPALQRLGYLDG